VRIFHRIPEASVRTTLSLATGLGKSKASGVAWNEGNQAGAVGCQLGCGIAGRAAGVAVDAPHGQRIVALAGQGAASAALLARVEAGTQAIGRPGGGGGRTAWGWSGSRTVPDWWRRWRWWGLGTIGRTRSWVGPAGRLRRSAAAHVRKSSTAGASSFSLERGNTQVCTGHELIRLLK
jgi:hypothetical protein